MNANPIMTVGLMLTLAGLVGTFFNIQLSQWLRDLIAVETKAALNKLSMTEAAQRAIVECRIELAKLNSRETYIINGAVIAFIVFVLINGLCMAAKAQTDPLYGNVNLALWVFLIFFVVMSAWLIFSGHRVAGRIKAAVTPTPS
jgi:D-alanyl-lipoteichoic acid acyltransferase DltB (MBOAT superfamily)